jgi:hypothetical protein
MLNNNISNHSAPVLAFNIDNTLFRDTPIKRDLLDRLKRSFTAPTEKDLYFERELNENTVNIINNLWYQHDFSIYLVTKHGFMNEIHEFLYSENLEYTKVVQYHGIDNLRRMVELRFFYYIDSDYSLLNAVAVKNAVHIDNISDYLNITKGNPYR